MDPTNLKKAMKESQKSHQFTKQDRQEVYKKLRETSQSSSVENIRAKYKKHLLPVMATLVMVSVFILVFIPSLVNDQDDDPKVSLSDSDELKRAKETSMFVMVINENNRTAINLLITVQNRTKKVNAVLLPPSLKVPIMNAEREEQNEDKLTHAFAYGGGAAAVKNTVENVMNMPIDYYFMWELEEAASFIKSMGDIKLHVNEGIELISADGERLAFSKGTVNVSGEEFMRVLSVDGENQPPPAFLNKLFTQVLHHLNTKDSRTFMQQGVSNLSPAEMKSGLKGLVALEMNTISLDGTLHAVNSDENYYVEMDERFRNQLRKQLGYK
jgi:polyisoprenyl-teichoic acid--peptidoglycan teichoic acid transferase